MNKAIIIFGSLLLIIYLVIGTNFFWDSYISWRWWHKPKAAEVKLSSVISGESIKVVTNDNKEIVVRLCGLFESNSKARLTLVNLLQKNKQEQLILIPVKYQDDPEIKYQENSEKPKILIGEIFRVNQGQEINLSLELLINSQDVLYSEEELEGFFYESDPNPRVIKSYRKGNGLCPNRQRIKKLYGYSLWKEFYKNDEKTSGLIPSPSGFEKPPRNYNFDNLTNQKL